MYKPLVNSFMSSLHIFNEARGQLCLYFYLKILFLIYPYIIIIDLSNIMYIDLWMWNETKLNLWGFRVIWKQSKDPTYDCKELSCICLPDKLQTSVSNEWSEHLRFSHSKHEESSFGEREREWVYSRARACVCVCACVHVCLYWCACVSSSSGSKSELSIQRASNLLVRWHHWRQHS
jgi:hypothetical protein